MPWSTELPKNCLKTFKILANLTDNLNSSSGNAEYDIIKTHNTISLKLCT